MSVEVLRRAASLMRERAEDATAGPWVSDEPAQTWRAWDGNVKTAHADFRDCDDRIAQVWANEDSQHIASWHPAVALAVADLLAILARRSISTDLEHAERDAALAIARAYLGESS